MGGVRCRVSIWFPMTLLLMMSLSVSYMVWLCLAASLVHECGHALMMWAVHDRPGRITVGLFGVHIERSAAACLGYRKVCAVSLAGPVINVIMGLLLWMLHCPIASAVNGGLALFNVLPITSLDGGEALYALLCERTDEATANRISHYVSLVVLFPLAVVGFWLMLAERGNYTLLLMCIYLIFLLLLKEKH